MTTLDLSKHSKPNPLSPLELKSKLAHMAGVLERAKADGVLLVQEGALRWLTGIRHQIIDIAPDAESPVHALAVRKGSGWEITFATTRIEMPRVKGQLQPVYEGVSELSVRFVEGLPVLPAGVLSPQSAAYAETVGEIVRPLVGGLEGNQYAKLEWLSCMTSAILAETAHALEPGMDGARVRGMLFDKLARWDVESNLIMVALSGQEGHFHPLYDARYKLEKTGWVKLVVGTRYADMIVSATLMIKFGGVPQDTQATYRALQEAVTEYADCYRAGALEADIFLAVGERFRKVGDRLGRPEIGRSAYAHHPGGPTSPLGNRDYIIEKGGTRRVFPWIQFAINPVEVVHAIKVEIQGVVRPSGSPIVLDASKFTPSTLQGFTKVTSTGGTAAMVPDIIAR